MLNRLDGSVVVILVNLLVDGCGHLFVAMRADLLLGNGSVDIFIDTGLVVTILGDEAGNGLLGSVHDYDCYCCQ